MFVATYSSGQESSLAYDELLECKEVVNNDTVQFYYHDDNGNPYYLRYPINSKISFKSDLKNDTLYSSSAGISGDTLTIYLTKQTFGLIIDVNIHVVKDKPLARVTYWTVLPNEPRKLKPKKVALILKNQKLKKGDRLIGSVNIEFTGQVVDELSMKETKISGEINGCFNIVIDKLSRSRLD